MIEASWAAVDPAIQHAKQADDVPEMYTSGSAGPACADALLARDNHKWKKVTSD
jgi:glucose-6-phosphate 1-dehydrogenase